jgi:hypothetical protein
LINATDAKKKQRSEALETSHLDKQVVTETIAPVAATLQTLEQ